MTSIRNIGHTNIRKLSVDFYENTIGVLGLYHRCRPGGSGMWECVIRYIEVSMYSPLQTSQSFGRVGCENRSIMTSRETPECSMRYFGVWAFSLDFAGYGNGESEIEWG